MISRLPEDINKIIIDKAKSLGASIAGMADAASVKNSPSHELDNKVKWDEHAKTILVLAVEHGEAEPELDWWDGKPGRTERVRQLTAIGKQIKQWLKNEFDIESKVLSYSIGRGGLYLKDAAALAGLGIIGKNNLLLTPEYGPRVRLSAMTIETELPPSEQLDYTPCDGCSKPCFRACSRYAFNDGTYSMKMCRIQMNEDEKNAEKNSLDEIVVKYCRDCELACPVGR